MGQAVRLPKMGSTMEEATLTRWNKEVGEKVEKNDVLFEIETDKSTLEVEAPFSGIVTKLLYDEGDVVPVSEIVCYLGEKGSSANNQGEMKAEQQIVEPTEGTTMSSVANDPQKLVEKPRILLSPAARRRARELGLTDDDIRLIKGSGPRDRIVLKDLESYSKQANISQQMEQVPQVPIEMKDKEVVALNRIRQITAQKLTASFRDVPQFTIKKHVDLTSITKVRNKLKSLGINISVNDFLIQASAQALMKNEIVNAYFSQENNEMNIIKNKDVNMGLAVALDNGLIVPVIKQANHLSLSEIVKKRKELIRKAKLNQLTSDEMTGGTFTISNLGSFDVDEFTAIINTPESAILAVGSALKKPVVTNSDQIEIKQMLAITASFDHRTVDGAEAARFMKDLTDLLESPDWEII